MFPVHAGFNSIRIWNIMFTAMTSATMWPQICWMLLVLTEINWQFTVRWKMFTVRQRLSNDWQMGNMNKYLFLRFTMRLRKQEHVFIMFYKWLVKMQSCWIDVTKLMDTFVLNAITARKYIVPCKWFMYLYY